MFDNVIVPGVVPPSLEPVVVLVISLFPCKRHSGSPENVGMSFTRGGDGQQERKRVGNHRPRECSLESSALTYKVTQQLL